MRKTLLFLILLLSITSEVFAALSFRNVKPLYFTKGSTTLSLSGQLNDTAMQNISDGNGLAVCNYLDSYLTLPTLLPKTKAGFGTKSQTQNVSVNIAKGKLKWIEKDVTPYFSFMTGNERIRPNKATFKSKGVLQTSELPEIEFKGLTIFDSLCADQGSGYLAALNFYPEKTGKNFKFAYAEGKFRVKGFIDSKGKIKAKYSLPPEIAYPAILNFTNKYNYSLVIIGEGKVAHGYCGPDQVEFRVTENNQKFRYFTYNGVKVTNEFLTLELEQDTEVQAVFGTYDLSINVIGDGAVSANFTGPDEVEVKVVDGSEIFLYYTVNGEKILDSTISLSLQEDTVIEAYFKNDYIVIDLSAGPTAKSYPVTHVYDVPEGSWTDEYKTTKMVLRKIKAGKFSMGSPEKELGRNVNETKHQVTLTNDYYIGVFEVTQKQYKLITGFNSSDHKGDTRPVEYVSYNELRGNFYGSAWPISYDVDEASFFGKLRAKTNLIFDLPTEAQWEYACRAGTTTALNSGKNLTSTKKCPNMAEVGRYLFNYNDKDDYYSEHAEVGSYKPNVWGLYDMHGNVEEWCLDWYKADLGSGHVTEPIGAIYGFSRVLRGGNYGFSSGGCRSAYRGWGRPSDHFGDNGFRVVLVQNVFSGPDNQIQKNFEFDIPSGTENTLPVFKVKLYGKTKNGEEYLLEEIGKLEYDGASGIVLGKGPHKLTWIPDNAYTNIADEIELRVEYEDVTSQAAYLVLDLPSNKMRTSANGPNIGNDKCRTAELWLRRIEPGAFTMGSPSDELGRSTSEVQHEVSLTKAYYIGVFEMTQKQCDLFVDCNPSYWLGKTRPVECVSYDLIRGAGNGSQWPLNHKVDENSILGHMRKKAGNIFDLPTEAQWEYACRAGTTTALNSGKNLTSEIKCPNLAKLGRYSFNRNDGKGGYNESHTTVGSYLPNAWGLYDMHGNVYEWCLDWYGGYNGNTTDPKGPSEEYFDLGRVLRGGSFFDYAFMSGGANCCRSARRYGYDPYYGFDLFGFRVVLVK